MATVSLRLDEAFDALGNVHRRRLLLGPRRRRHTHLDAATWDVAIGGDRDRDRLKLELFHVCLSKLADTGPVGWNHHRDFIARGPRFDEIGLPLRFLNEHAGEPSVGGCD